MSERITARLKEFRLTSTSAASPAPAPQKPEVHFDADAEEKTAPKVDKGKGRAIDDDDNAPLLASPPPLSPPLPPTKLETNPVPPPPAPPIVVAGISFTPQELSDLLVKAKKELPLRPVRFPLLGEYQDAFTGEEFTTWLRENIDILSGNLDRAEDTAKELTEKHGLLRRLGELGNEYENSDEAFFQFRAKVLVPDRPNILVHTQTLLQLGLQSDCPKDERGQDYLTSREEPESPGRERRQTGRWLCKPRDQSTAAEPEC